MKFKTLLFLMSCFGLLFLSKCSKDDGIYEDLMKDSIEYDGVYPEVAEVSYIDSGVTVTVDAIPGQFLIYFRTGVSDQIATNIITSNGGMVLGKIPSIGFYHINIDVSSVNSFISTLRSKTEVFAIKPNTVSYPKAGVIVLDACNGDHGIRVKAALQSCGGNLERCSYVPVDKKDGVPTNMVVNAITGFTNISNGGTTLINISFNAGLVNKDWSLASQKDKDKARQDWEDNMYCLLNDIANIPEIKRRELVITMAAGNENMPVSDILIKFRTMYSDNGVSFEEILKNNFLIVTTNIKMSNGLYANYSIKSDPDVVVLNESAAFQGTSGAAPCVMGFIDSIMRVYGKSAREVLKTVKLASTDNTDRLITLNKIKSHIGALTYSAKGTVILKSPHGNSTDYTLTEHILKDLKILYRPSVNDNKPILYFSQCYQYWTYVDGKLYDHKTQKCILGQIPIWKDSADKFNFVPYSMSPGSSNGIAFEGIRSKDRTKIDVTFWIDWEPKIKVPVVFTIE